jgi:uncharacterized membrane protein YbhN (UPF0104 family)
MHTCELTRLRSWAASPVARICLTCLGIAIAVWQIDRSIGSWSRLGHSLVTVGPGWLVAATVALLIGGIAALLSWARVMAPLVRPTREWAQVFYIGQLGKYLPGSIWAAAMQAEMGRRLGASRLAMFWGFVWAFGISVAAAAVVALPLLLHDAPPVVVVGAAVLAALATWAVVRSGPVRTLVRRTTRDASGGTRLGAAFGWSLVGWLVAGTHLTLLAIAFGADPQAALITGIGASAASVALGSLVVITPGGLGTRELVLLGCLTPLLGPVDAAAVTLLSRAVYLCSDLLLAAGSACPAANRKLVRTT